MSVHPEPVDLLAVMDAAINLRAAIYNDGRGSSCSDVTANRKANLDDAIEARAAIAELIEADKRVSERSRKKAGGGFWMVSNEDMAALRAAIARVGGAK